MRKGWDALSPNVRKRYERAGITKRRYEYGEPLAKARGHATTPERPARADETPDRYRDYLHRKGLGHGMIVITTTGVEVVEGMPFGDRSLVGKHLNAVQQFLATGKTIPSRFGLKSKLSDFTGKTVKGFRPDSDLLETFTLETDPRNLTSFRFLGMLDFLDVYEDAGVMAALGRQSR
jgi:hypothetical protein